MESFLQYVEEWVWGPPLLILLTFVGIYLTFVTRGVQLRYLFYSIKLAFSRHDDQAQGDISHFQALMTSLAATIGIGSIAGVATAVVAGGLGALFWIWVSALLGMATKFAEAVLAIKYRTIDEKKEMCGGPMYYLEKGLKSKFLAVFFAIVGAITAVGTGNMVQANSVSSALGDFLNVNPWVCGIILAFFTALALFGGIKSIGKVTSYLVPAMAMLYIGGGIVVIMMKFTLIPAAFGEIFRSAFTGQAAFGGFVGSTFMMAVQYGISRGVFSSEAGLGSAPIAAAAAKTDVPGRQALVSMSGVFLTSFIVVTITGLVIAVTNSLGTVSPEGIPVDGAVLVLSAFDTIFPKASIVVTISLILFAYSTILGWAYYGEKCVEYLFGVKAVFIYRVVYIIALILGAVLSIKVVWSFANIMNGLMALPNLIGLLGLAAIVKTETKLFDEIVKKERQ